MFALRHLLLNTGSNTDPSIFKEMSTIQIVSENENYFTLLPVSITHLSIIRDCYHGSAKNLRAQYREEHLLNRYGIVPNKGELLRHQLEVSRYFLSITSKNQAESIFNGRGRSISIQVILPSCKLTGLLISVLSQLVANTPFDGIYQSLRAQHQALVISMKVLIGVLHLRRKLAS
jgi:hypothetical protein